MGNFRARPWWLIVSLAVTACSADAPEPITATQRALSRRVDLLPRQSRWEVSATAGDRGTAWRDGSGSLDGWEGKAAPIGYGETYVTPIGYGTEPANKPTTVYFRNGFWINDDPTLIETLRLDAMYDDGFVAYLNGQEVVRAHLPAGEITYATLSDGHETGNNYVSFDLTAARALLVRGYNHLTVEVHQVSPSSSDLTFDVALVAGEIVPPPTAAEGLITADSVWSYWDKGNLEPSWRTGDFDVSTWDYGPGPLGYGETYLATVLGYGGDPANKHPVTYFRKQLILNQPDSITSLYAEVMYDDGFDLYLNGQLVVSVPPTGHEGNNAYETFNLSVPAGLLVPGVNTVAVEVRQANATSSDVVFDLVLYPQYKEPPPVYVETIARGATWSFWDGGDNLGTAWRMPGYSDANWHTGTGPLGYGEDYLHTIVASGSNPAQKPVTTYFRKKFSVDLSHGDSVTDVLLDLLYDDGAVVYLNGVELIRPGMGSGPTGGIGAADLAQGHEANKLRDLTRRHPLDPQRDLVADAAGFERVGPFPGHSQRRAGW